MRVGVLTASISRQAGGLFWSVRSLAEGVKQAGCEVQVFSIADQFSAEDVAQWQDLDLRLPARRGPSAFGHAPGFNKALNGAHLDLVHTQGLWMYPSVAALGWSKRWARPLLVSPRGMLDPWAIYNSRWKKQIAGVLYENRHLRVAACLHALCTSEYESIRAYGLRNPVAVIPNGVVLPETSDSLPKPDWAADLPVDSKVLLFLSRIHPKKGLVNLLRAWARLRDEQSAAAAPWQLVVAGWDQGGHQAELQQLAESLGLDESVRFVGPQFNEHKAASLARADAFVLPSFSEGLPMAVLDAWSYRLPVLMTPQCNLPEGFQAKAAIDMAPEVNSIADGLISLFNLPKTERLAMGQRGRNLVEKCFTWPIVAAQMCTVYAWVLGQGPQPSCVLTD